MVDGRLPLAQREARAKQLVIAQLSNPILELSGEVYRLDDHHGEWFYNEMRTDPGEDGPVVTTAFHRPMRGLSHQLRRAVDFIPHAEHVLESAYDQRNDSCCVPRQLAELLGEDFDELCADFDSRIENWRPRGITSRELSLFCSDRGLPWRCLTNGLVSEENPKDPQGPCVCWTIWGEHCYMYRKPVEFGNQKLQPRLRGETLSDVPPVLEWLQCDGEVRVGIFFHSNLAFVRPELLEKGIVAKVVPHAMKDYTALRIQVTKEESCVIRTLEEHSEAMYQFVRNIGFLGTESGSQATL
jgi:hypothetical protein